MKRNRTVVCLAAFAVAGWSLASRGDERTPYTPSLADFYAALLEPSMADGEISDAERDAILKLARRTLAPGQVAEVERQIAAFVNEPSPATRPAAAESTTTLPRRATESPAIAAETARASSLAHALSLETDAAKIPDIASAPTGLFDNLYLTGSLDGFKTPVDFGLNGHFSFNMGANWGIPVNDEWSLGAQLGSTVNFASFLVPFFKSATDLHDRVQSFTTAGLFQRCDAGLNWGVAYDFLYDDYYLNMKIGQWRGQIGYEITCDDEIGAWGALGDHGDSGSVDFPFFSGVVHWKAIDQINLFWTHTWSNDATTKWWFGVADTESDFAFGGEFIVPLNEHWVLFGAANFLATPSDGATTASTGLAFYPAGTALHATRSRFAPLLPVANNGTFVLDRF